MINNQMENVRYDVGVPKVRKDVLFFELAIGYMH